MSFADVERERASGSSRTRIKIAKYLRKFGFSVESSDDGCPPTDEDFALAILDHAVSRPFVLSFEHRSEQLKIKIPTPVFAWLVLHPGEEYNVLDAASEGYRKSSTYILSMKDSGWVFRERLSNRTYARPFDLSRPRQ